MWHRWRVHTGDLAHEQVSCAKSLFFFSLNRSKSFHSIALNVYFYIHVVYLFHFKHISSKNISIITKKKAHKDATFGNAAIRESLALFVFLK